MVRGNGVGRREGGRERGRVGEGGGGREKGKKEVKVCGGRCHWSQVAKEKNGKQERNRNRS